MKSTSLPSSSALADAPVTKEKSCVICGAMFSPRNRTYTTCSPACQKQRHRRANQRWDEANPQRALAHKRKRSRKYKAKNAEGIRQQRRQHYAEHREIVVPKKFGLTPEDFRTMLAAQNGRCAICRRTSSRRLCIDHDHQTGKVRGLLCHRCNTSLGLLSDDPLRLLAAVDYLMRASAA